MLLVSAFKRKRQVDLCSTDNKNPETDIAVLAEGQESKTAKPLKKSYLYQGWAAAD